ncbi:MAG: LamG domain-containing protein, partial [Rhodospirillales bacterium]|nr:LamG domain-containing protein [Rhodospirillales bacterium]
MLRKPLIRSGGKKNYEILNSALFDGSTGYLTWTPSTTQTDAKKVTVSFWFKKNDPVVSGTQRIFTSTTPDSVGWESGDAIFAEHQTGTYSLKVSNSKQRDTNDWTHCVWVFDSTLSAVDRVKLYLNNEQQTWASGANVDSNSTSTWCANGNACYIACYYSGLQHWDGYLADFYSIDGQTLTPDAFAEYSSNGDWVAKKYVSTYGSNGFYLDFSNPNTTNFSAYFFTDTGDTTWNNYTLRQKVTSANISTKTGGKVRIKYHTRSNAACTVSALYIGSKASSGNDWDFDGNQVQLTWDGGNASSGNIPANSEKYTDWIYFDVDGVDLIVGFDTTGGGGGRNNSSATGCNLYSKAGSPGEAGATAPTGYSTNLNQMTGVLELEVQQDHLGTDNSGNDNHWDVNGAITQV